MISVVYIIVTNGITIRIKKETTIKEEEKPLKEFQQPTPEELKTDPTTEVFEDALRDAYSNLDEILGGENNNE